jgi:hypothetical protein
LRGIDSRLEPRELGFGLRALRRAGLPRVLEPTHLHRVEPDHLGDQDHHRDCDPGHRHPLRVHPF